MGAVFPMGGGGFRRHLDNPPRSVRNGRILTAVYYLNVGPPRWRGEVHGGQLQIFPPPLPPAPSSGDSTGGDGAVLSVDPVGDRLVVFWSRATWHAVDPIAAEASVATATTAATTTTATNSSSSSKSSSSSSSSGGSGRS